MIPRVLTIAGSDSGGGAGIQADLKTFTVFRTFGMSAVTALTAQNTLGVSAIHPVPPDFVRAQIDAVVGDIGVDGVKTGMLANRTLVETVAAAVRDWKLQPLVVDPVMVAQSGAALLDEEARSAVIKELFPLATLVTPNLPEAEALTGRRIRSVPDLVDAAKACLDLGARACLVKGGHLEAEGDDNEVVDVWCDGNQVVELASPRIASRDTHGTGCQMSAAITALLARGQPLDEAIRTARHFILKAIAAGCRLGAGAGPANPLAWLAEE